MKDSIKNISRLIALNENELARRANIWCKAHNISTEELSFVSYPGFENEETIYLSNICYGKLILGKLEVKYSDKIKSGLCIEMTLNALNED